MFSWARGVHALAISESLNLAFISNERLPKISVLNLSGVTEVIDQLSRSPGKGEVFEKTIPFAMIMTPSVKTQNAKVTPSLLIGDHPSLMLSTVEFDPVFRTMDVVASAFIGIRIGPGSSVQADPINNLITQPMLIGSDDSQTAILVGDLFSTQLVQMTRGTRGVTLERTGEIELPGMPSSISVSGDGKAAVVVIANSHEVQLLQPSKATSNVPDPDSKIRQLQRDLIALGLDVGGIDGKPGTATVTALNTFNSATGNNVSLKNIDDALNSVESFSQNCPTSGLRCLLSGQQKK